MDDAVFGGSDDAAYLAAAMLGVAVATLIAIARGGASWLFVVLAPFAAALSVATSVDLVHKRIPNSLTYPLAPAMAVLLVVPTLAGEGTWADYRRAWFFGLALPAGMLAVRQLYRLLRGRLGIGMGDVKLAVSLGLVIGWLGGWEVVAMLFVTTLSCAVVAVGLLVSGRAKLAAAIPYGPYLALGALTVLFVGDPLAVFVQSLLGL